MQCKHSVPRPYLMAAAARMRGSAGWNVRIEGTGDETAKALTIY